MTKFGKDKFEIVVPSVSILAEPDVAIVDKVVGQEGTRAAARPISSFLYSPKDTRSRRQNHYRPRDPARAKKHESEFAKVEAFHDRRHVRRLGARQQAAHFIDAPHLIDLQNAITVRCRERNSNDRHASAEALIPESVGITMGSACECACVRVRVRA